jgi:hypothetical protein
MQHNCAHGIRPVFARVMLIVLALGLVSKGTLDAREKSSVPDRPQPLASPAARSSAAWPAPDIGTVDADVFKLALGAATCAVRSGAVEDPSTLTVIDYSKPSTEKRLWVFDLRAHKLLYEELVAHGQGSGGNLATVFSNEADTHRTSLGLFVTEDTYVGKNGYSLRLDGLDQGFNDHARERAIVMHGAPYVSEQFVQTQGRLGRSWGCPALREDVARPLIDRVKGGGLVFAYYPDQDWLKTSKFLSCNNNLQVATSK